MLLPILTSLFPLLDTTFAAPVNSKRCDGPIETDPWIISNFTAFNAASASGQPSYIWFHFCDQNAGLELDTNCHSILDAGASLSSINSDYLSCENNNVEYMYDGGSMTLQRYYIDDCIGAYPYNEATAYGEASMDTNKSTTQEGDTCTQAVLVVEITEMA